MNSTMIVSNINCLHILRKIQRELQRELQRLESEYELENYSSDCFVGWKQWLSNEDFCKGITTKKVNETLNEVIEEEVKSKNKYTKISQNMIEGKAFESINNFIPLFICEVASKWKGNILLLNY